MTRRKPNFIFIGLGILCILGSVGLVTKNNVEAKTAGEYTEKVSTVLDETPPLYNVTQLKGNFEAIPDYILNPKMKMPTVEIDGGLYVGKVKVPDLGIELPIQSTWDYEKLKASPCMYQGSIYQDNAIIMAHNYKTHFKPLRNAQVGMKVVFQDVDGNVFNYTVNSIEDIPTSGNSKLVSKDSNWDLTLFTCSYSGKTRTTLRCVKDDVSNI